MGRRWAAVRTSRGFTFIELLVVTTIVLILASAIMPLSKVTVQRQREAELHRYLREMRVAIDKYKDAVDNGLIGSIDVKAGSEGYPPDLETLVEGVSVANDASGRKLKFLRRVPDRSDDPLDGVGSALVPGQGGRDILGRSERLRRLHQVDGHRARRHQVSRMVNAEP